jgi:hypothetical protein
VEAVPWIVAAALGVVCLVLAKRLASLSRSDGGAKAAVRLDMISPSSPPGSGLDVAASGRAPSQRPAARRVSSAHLSSAAEARQAAKAAIARRDIRGAAVHYREAGLIDEAVNLLVGVLGAPIEAAEMLSSDGDHQRAADLYELAGRKAKAAREWAKVAETSLDPQPYLRRVRRLDPGLADALEGASTGGFDVHAAPTRMVTVPLKDLILPDDPVDEEVPESDEVDTSAMGLPDDEAARLADAAAEAVTRAFDSNMPAEGVDGASDPVRAAPAAPMPAPSLPASSHASWNGGLEEEAIGDVGASIVDAAVQRAGVAIPLWELEAMTRDQACELSNIEVFYRIGMGRLAIGDWASALTALDAVEKTSAGYRDAEARAQQVRAWQLYLGRRRTIGDRLDILGRFEERADSIVYRARDRSSKRDALLHVPRSGPEADFETRAAELALLDHPNMTRVIGGVAIDGGGVLCSETADGPTLSARIALGSRPTVVEALRLTTQLCEAMEAGGSRGGQVIDPTDLRIAPGGLLKVMRWGWSGPTAPTGPSVFAAPELETGSGDGRAHVFAVGAVLVSALAGDEDLGRASHLDETWRTIEERAPYLPAAVQAVARRATAGDPASRFGSLKELRVALRGLLKQIHRRASNSTLPAVRG